MYLRSSNSAHSVFPLPQLQTQTRTALYSAHTPITFNIQQSTLLTILWSTWNILYIQKYRFLYTKYRSIWMFSISCFRFLNSFWAGSKRLDLLLVSLTWTTQALKRIIKSIGARSFENFETAQLLFSLLTQYNSNTCVPVLIHSSVLDSPMEFLSLWLVVVVVVSFLFCFLVVCLELAQLKSTYFVPLFQFSSLLDTLIISMRAEVGHFPNRVHLFFS